MPYVKCFEIYHSLFSKIIPVLLSCARDGPETPQAKPLRAAWETEAGALAEDPVCPCSP